MKSWNNRLVLICAVAMQFVCGCGEAAREPAVAEIQSRMPEQSRAIQAQKPNIKDWDGGKGGK